MSLSDPFSTTYAGAFKAGSSLGEGLQEVGKGVGEAIKQRNSQKRAMETLKMLQETGLQKKEEPLSTDEFNAQAEDIIRTNAEKFGAKDLQIMGSDNPEERRKQYQAILDPLGLTPKPKVTNVLDANAMSSKFDISVDSDGKISYKIKETNPMDALLKAENYKYMKNVNDQMSNGGKNDLIYRSASTGEEVPASVAQQEIAKGSKDYIVNRKIVSKSGVKEEPVIGTAEKKLIEEQKEKSKLDETKRQAVLDTADDTLNTISEIEKNMNYFGMQGALFDTPGTDKVNWRANLDKLTAKKLFDKLSELKSQSQTGATGLGQLAVKEFDNISKAATALKATLSKKDAQRYLTQMKDGMNKIKAEMDKNTKEGSQSEDPEYQNYLKAIGQ